MKGVTSMRTIQAFALGTALCAATALAQPAATPPHRPSITSITVCESGPGDPGPSCPPGTSDTHRIVLGPDGNSINANGAHGASDEHASIFPPGSLRGNAGHLFFLASGVSVNPDIGVIVLSGGKGPDKNGQWTMSFTPDYGNYPPEGSGTVFLAPTVQGRCPRVADIRNQDQTFDLGYAAAGSVVMDRTSGPGHLLMIYEGANACVGNDGGHKSGDGAYISVGAATSADDGRSWPLYRSTPFFDAVPLPHANPLPGNPVEGPDAPSGALGGDVCVGNDCAATPPPTYGRYPVVSPPVSLTTMITSGQTITQSVGDSEPSAFLDDVRGGGSGPGDDAGSAPWVYAVFRDLQTKDLSAARARLNGGKDTLRFSKWNGTFFAENGIGGTAAPILPGGDFGSCGDPSQSRSQGSISYVDETGQYLLLFVCGSPGDPHAGSAVGQRGSAWFWSTSDDLSSQQWSVPLEIEGSWMPWDTGNPPGSFGCQSYKGWYPTLMSLDHAPGHLTTRGYVFYMWGCLGGSTASPPQRQYSSRRFTIHIASPGSDEQSAEAHPAATGLSAGRPAPSPKISSALRP
jgi:hypothetical protein